MLVQNNVHANFPSNQAQNSFSFFLLFSQLNIKYTKRLNHDHLSKHSRDIALAVALDPLKIASVCEYCDSRARGEKTSVLNLKGWVQNTLDKT